MKRHASTKLSIICLVVLLSVQGVLAQHQELRPITVADSIGMTVLDVRDTDDAAIWSPNGEKFLLVTHRGNLQKNTNDYSLLLFRSKNALHGTNPQVLLVLSSASNKPAISNVRWCADSITVLFLAAMLHQKQQIYSFNINSRRLTQLTRHPTDILAFDATRDLRTMAYLAKQPIRSIVDQVSEIRGLLITSQPLGDLLNGHSSDDPWAAPAELFVTREKTKAAAIVWRNQETPVVVVGISLSPDGRHAIVMINTRKSATPASWREYKTSITRETQTECVVYMIIDTVTQAMRVLGDAPAFSIGGVAWSADGRSVIVSGNYLPLNVDDPSERETRKATGWAVEVNVRTNYSTKIAAAKPGYYYQLLKWDSKTATLYLKPRLISDVEMAGDVMRRSEQALAYRKTGDRWEKVDSVIQESKREFNVREEQDMNTPPHLVTLDPTTGKKSLLMNSNPQFSKLHFGRVEEVSWKGSDGTAYAGGLYLPPDYAVGITYPFVIQTHGWNPEIFSMDGLSTAGYAARALAAAGFVVAQTRIPKQLGTTLEGPENMSMFEGLIDSLSARGMIDRSRVGLLGWSRTGYHVRYTLAFSKYPIAAAIVADGMDGGYWQYIVGLNQPAFISQLFEGQNGTAPFGPGRQSWLEKAPSFNLDRVYTPIRQLGFGPFWYEYNWESFVALRRLGRPVELIWLPDALHEPVKPSERMVAQQGTVDWFRFWLQSYEDPDQAKVQQYARWRELRKLYDDAQKLAQKR